MALQGARVDHRRPCYPKQKYINNPEFSPPSSSLFPFPPPHDDLTTFHPFRTRFLHRRRSGKSRRESLGIHNRGYKNCSAPRRCVQVRLFESSLYFNDRRFRRLQLLRQLRNHACHHRERCLNQYASPCVLSPPCSRSPIAAAGFLGPCSMNTPHIHPRSAEFNYVTNGSLITGMILEDGAKFIFNEVKANQAALFPQGSIHFEYNDNCESVTFVASFRDSSPGVR